MPNTTLSLPTDVQNQRTWGMLDQTTNAFSLVRARFIQTVSVNSTPTQIGDMGVVLVGADGTMAAVSPWSAVLATSMSLPSTSGAGLQLTYGLHGLLTSTGSTYDQMREASPTGAPPGDTGLVPAAQTLYDSGSGHWQHARTAASVGDADSGLYTSAVSLRAFNGTSYDRLTNDSNKNLRVTLRDASNNTLTFSSGRLPVDGSGVTQPVSGTITVVQGAASSLNAQVTIPDGSATTIGSLADTAWGGSGNGSVVAVLKAVYAKVAAPLTVQQATAANLNVQAQIADGASVTLGAKADSAWSGSGAGSLVAISKAQYALLAGTLAVDPTPAATVSASSPPSTTNAGSNTAYTFASSVHRVVIQNKSTINVYFDFDSNTASLGSAVLTPTQLIALDYPCTTLNLYTASSININGTSDGNVFVRGLK